MRFVHGASARTFSSRAAASALRAKWERGPHRTFRGTHSMAGEPRIPRAVCWRGTESKFTIL